MGMLLAPLYGLLIWIYYMIYSRMRKEGKGFFFSLFTTFVASLPFTYDIVITHMLTFYYCNVASPHPVTKVVKTVEYPESVYWEDNVYPGFGKSDRKLMIVNYLNGKHLKTMALNGNDGKIYVYHLEKPIWEKLKSEHKELSALKLDDAYANEVMKSEKVYTKESMPMMHYTVTFNEVKLSSFSGRFFYSDESKIIENKTKATIAYNRRYMRFFYNIEPTFMGGSSSKYYSSLVCGYFSNAFERTLIMLKGPGRGTRKHYTDLNEKLYYKYEK